MFIIVDLLTSLAQWASDIGYEFPASRPAGMLAPRSNLKREVIRQ